MSCGRRESVFLPLLTEGYVSLNQTMWNTVSKQVNKSKEEGKHTLASVLIVFPPPQDSDKYKHQLATCDLTSVIYQTNLLLVLKFLNSVNENRLIVAIL